LRDAARRKAGSFVFIVLYPRLPALEGKRLYPGALRCRRPEAA
jgi:hypothetical protein